MDKIWGSMAVKKKHSLSLFCVPKSVWTTANSGDRLFKVYFFFSKSTSLKLPGVTGCRARFQKACIYLNHYASKVRKEQSAAPMLCPQQRISTLQFFLHTCAYTDGKFPSLVILWQTLVFLVYWTCWHKSYNQRLKIFWSFGSVYGAHASTYAQMTRFSHTQSAYVYKWFA